MSPAPAIRSSRCWRSALAAGAGLGDALRMANAAAAVAVGKKGTASVTPAELRRQILPHASLAAEEKIVPSGATRGAACRLAQAGPADRLHQWLFRYPASRPRQGADRGARRLRSPDRRPEQRCLGKRLKGEGRPVQNERARAEVLAALEAVDLVAIFEEDTPLKLIEQIKPSVLVKGGDYTREQVVGHEIVEAAWRRGDAGRDPGGLQHDLAGRSRARRQGDDALAAPASAGRCCGGVGAIRPPG